jgi:hypothetical protein
MTDTAAIRLRRVTLPRYELEYRDRAHALVDAERIVNERILEVPQSITEAVGSEVVFDLSVEDMTLRATLLFRVIVKPDGRTVLEWWARRSTDPALLDLWLTGLRGEAPNPFDTPDSESIGDDARPPVDPNDRKRLLALCRRLMTRNPFTALDLHWTAGERDVQDAWCTIRDDLVTLRPVVEAEPALMQFVEQARRGLDAAVRELKTPEARARTRQRYIAAEQIENALLLARQKLSMARVRSDGDEILAQRRVIAELEGRP